MDKTRAFFFFLDEPKTLLERKKKSKNYNTLLDSPKITEEKQSGPKPQPKEPKKKKKKKNYKTRAFIKTINSS